MAAGLPVLRSRQRKEIEAWDYGRRLTLGGDARIRDQWACGVMARTRPQFHFASAIEMAGSPLPLTGPIQHSPTWTNGYSSAEGNGFRGDWYARSLAEASATTSFRTSGRKPIVEVDGQSWFRMHGQPNSWHRARQWRRRRSNRTRMIFTKGTLTISGVCALQPSERQTRAQNMTGARRRCTLISLQYHGVS